MGPTRFRNLLLLLSDEHAGSVLGCGGHAIVHTPHLDALARSSRRYTAAYTNSPICIPARAALATGRWASDIGAWDNAFAYAGQPDGWAHALRAAGWRTAAIGKLHFRDAHCDVGFDEQIEAMHVVEGTGDLLGCVRDPPPPRHKSRAVATEIGAGESSYTRYDRAVTDAACAWLGRHGAGAPWALQVGWVAPHFPLIAPPDCYALYDAPSMPLPKATRPEQWPDHAWLNALRNSFITDRFHTDATRRVAIASYYALVSSLDRQVGQVLAALQASGAAQDTLVIYTSDHGDNMGARGLWGKSTMYEESAGIPLLLHGQGLKPGVCDVPVSLVDVAATLVDAAGLEIDRGWRGESLLRLAPEIQALEGRFAFSEYHAAGSPSAAFMLRRGTWKYVHYVGLEPQLFDLGADPQEWHDLAKDPVQAPRLAQFDRLLREQVDPEALDQRAKSDQTDLLARHGGRDAVVSRGGFGATPPPGESARFS